MSDTRKISRVSVVVHSETTGDPIILDPGFQHTDEIEKTFYPAGIQTDSRGRPLLEWLPDQGLTNRAFRIAQNTTLSMFSTSGGSWETEKPGTSAPRVDQITQYDVADAVVYSATTNATQPANPNFAFSLILPDTPAHWDAATRPPYVRVEWGGEWGVQFEKDATFLMRRVAGTWGAVLELDNPPRGTGYEDLERIWVWVRHVDGQIGVSMDEGRSYKWYGVGISVPAAKLTLRGQGGSVTFGLAQLYQAAGYYQPEAFPTGRVRGATAATITGVDRWLPSGVAAPTFSDQSTPSQEKACYRVTLTPTPVATGFGWNYYYAPVQRVVTFQYAVTTTLPVLATSTLWDNVLVGATVRKPRARDTSSAELFLDVQAYASFAWSRFRERKIEIWMWALLQDGTEDTPVRVFTGYVRCIHLVYDRFGSVKIRITADNASVLFRRPWGVDQIYALGGQTLNSAADSILVTEGLQTALATYRNWHALGDSILVDRGHWRELAHLTQAQELKWETLLKLFGRYGLDVGVTDDGTFESYPRFVNGLPYVSGINWAKRFVPVTGSTLRDLVKGATRRLDSAELATTVQVVGALPDGRRAWRMAEDGPALDPLLAAATGRFAPRRYVHVEEISGSTDPVGLIRRTQALGYELFPVREDLDLVQPVDLRVKRNDEITLYDAGPIDVPDGTTYKVEELQHDWSAEDTLSESTTLALLRRR